MVSYDAGTRKMQESSLVYLEASYWMLRVARRLWQPLRLILTQVSPSEHTCLLVNIH